MNLDLWMQIVETYGKGEKTALGVALMHAEGDRWKGRAVTPCVWGMLRAKKKKKMVLPGKIPVCQGFGFLTKNLGESCLIYLVCPIEGVGGSAHSSFCCSTPKGLASL